MASYFQRKKDSNEGQEDDLKKLLSASEREAFSLLIVSIIEEMKRNLLFAFDASYTSPSSSSPHDDANLSSEEKVERERKAKEKLEARKREIQTREMRELKMKVLRYFDNWGAKVTKRVGEVLDVSAQQQEDEARSAAAAATTSGMTEDAEIKISESDVAAHQQHQLDADEALAKIYPPTPTALAKLDREKRSLILNSTLLLLLSLKTYDALSRVLLLHMATSLHLPLSALSSLEQDVAATLLKAASAMSADSETAQAAASNASSRKWKVGLASVAGAALIGITGGLAAPLVASGIGAVMGGLGLGATAAAGLLGALAQSGVLVGALFGAYGGKMGGEMMDVYAKEVEDFQFLPLRGETERESRVDHRSGTEEKKLRVGEEEQRLRVTIGISGWLTEESDVLTPWKCLGDDTSVAALRFELSSLLSLGRALSGYLKSYAWGYAKKELLKRTIFASLMVALWPLAFLKASKVLDNPFSIAMARSEKAGRVLADALGNRVQGERPVNLVGYSLGARAIYFCLLTLAERGQLGVIENAVLIGSPVPGDSLVWRKMRTVVAGRLVNVYSENDYVLGFLYRTANVQRGIAGLQAVDVKGVENVDASDLVSGHLRYQYLTGTILEQIGWQDLDRAEIAKEKKEADRLEREERERDEEVERREAESGAKSEEQELVKIDGPEEIGEGRPPKQPPRPTQGGGLQGAGENVGEQKPKYPPRPSEIDELEQEQRRDPREQRRDPREQKWRDTDPRTEEEKTEKPLEQMHF